MRNSWVKVKEHKLVGQQLVGIENLKAPHIIHTCHEEYLASRKHSKVRTSI